MTWKRILLAVIVVGVVAAMAVVYYSNDPSSDTFFPRCAWLGLTGTKCPGCGSQRAMHSLLHGDIAGAWRYNAFMIAVLPVIAFYAVAEFTRKRFPRFYMATGHPAVVTLILLSIVLWWVLRNVFDW